MASLLSTLTRTTTFSRHFHKHLLSSTPTSYTATRSISFNVTNEENYPNNFNDNLKAYREMEHPFLRRGSKMPVENEHTFDAIHLRVDMPGVGNEGLKLWIEKGYLNFEGHEGEKDTAIDKEKVKRKYCGSFYMDMDRVCVDQIKAQMKNGVLKVVIPKVMYGTF